jgi:hypothetical protein
MAVWNSWMCFIGTLFKITPIVTKETTGTVCKFGCQAKLSFQSNIEVICIIVPGCSRHRQTMVKRMKRESLLLPKEFHRLFLNQFWYDLV